MTKLSVNVNKLATIRNSRGKNNPDVLKTALKIISYGAHGITVHPRPDERHIRRSDVRELAKEIKKNHPSIEFNIEGYPDETYLKLIEEVGPDQATLVPDQPEALTSDAGWKLEPNSEFLKAVIERIRKTGARVSVFMDPIDFSSKTISHLKEVGTDRIELYTEAYALAFSTPEQAKVAEKYLALAKAAHEAGFGINAGHDLDLNNLKYLVTKIPLIDEVSIGHALICDALEKGLEKTIESYLNCLK